MARSNTSFQNFGEGGSGGDDEDIESAGVESEEGEGQLVDLSGYDENASQYPTLARGKYDAELIEMEYGQSQRSGNNMWTTIWEVLDPKLADKNGKQPRLYFHLTFTEGGLPRIKR